MSQEITNENYVIYWTSPIGNRIFGVAVAALGSEGDRPRPVYRYYDNGASDTKNYDLFDECKLTNTDGCCWDGWPPHGLSRAEHEKSLLVLLLRLVSEGIPLDLAWDEFKKIPIFREMNVKLPTDILDRVVNSA